MLYDPRKGRSYYVELVLYFKNVSESFVFKCWAKPDTNKIKFHAPLLSVVLEFRFSQNMIFISSNVCKHKTFSIFTAKTKTKMKNKLSVIIIKKPSILFMNQRSSGCLWLDLRLVSVSSMQSFSEYNWQRTLKTL